jgi:hypothetical protein
MPAWLLKILLWIVQTLAGPTAAREAGRQDAKIDQLQAEVKVKDEQLEVAAAPRADRDAVLQRMRNNSL